MYEDINDTLDEEKSYNGLKLAIIFVLFAFITFILTFIFLVAKVDAQSFTPATMNFYGIDSGGNTYSYTIYNVNSYTFPNPTWQFINGTQMNYNGLNIQPNKTYLFKIVVNYRTFYESQLQFTPTIQIQLNNIASTCDFMIENSNVQTEADSSHNAYSLRTIYSCYIDSTITATTMYLNYYTGKQQQLKNFSVELEITEKEPNQEDVINNNNANTDRIIENNNYNTDRSIFNWNYNTDRILHSNSDTQQAMYDNTQAVETMDAHITSSNVSSDTGTNFFNNFQENHHGLSGIITAPLVAINTLLEGDSCTDMSATYKDKTFSFPCGRILWGKTNVAPLKTFLNLTFGGLICYAIIRKLFLKVHELKNPEDDRIEVMDL